MKLEERGEIAGRGEQPGGGELPGGLLDEQAAWGPGLFLGKQPHVPSAVDERAGARPQS